MVARSALIRVVDTADFASSGEETTSSAVPGRVMDVSVTLAMRAHEDELNEESGRAMTMGTVPARQATTGLRHTPYRCAVSQVVAAVVRAPNRAVTGEMMPAPQEADAGVICEATRDGSYRVMPSTRMSENPVLGDEHR